MNGFQGRNAINTTGASSVRTNADEINMYEVKQSSSGSGVISHNASRSLNQIGNTIDIEGGGQIINQSDGELNQIDNKITMKGNGKIINTVKNTSLVMGVVFILDLLANILGITEFVSSKVLNHF